MLLIIAAKQIRRRTVVWGHHGQQSRRHYANRFVHTQKPNFFRLFLVGSEFHSKRLQIK